jgi:hypothetical protein
MILLSYIVLNLIVLFLFIKKKKNLHILEILIYWMVASYLFQNLSALCYMNFKTLLIPDKLELELTHFLNRIVLFPVIMVTFLHYYLTFWSQLKKGILLLTFMFLLVGLEWLSDLSGVITHVDWKIWWSFSFWLTALLVLVSFMNFFRKILFKGGRFN